MKNIYYLLCLVFLFSCSSDDDNGPTLDTNLLFGEWFEVGLCPSQNRLELEPSFTYETYSSGGIDCDDPAPDTYRFNGTFSIQGNLITFVQTDANLVIDGTDLTVLDFPNPDIRHEVTELTEDSLVIRVYIDLGNNITEELGNAIYER
ncbi:hypothetical protein [Psychroserpens sp.]|uniref:hypothetical protein n=1 Tax=Psychroserpens sp. TaxID=2020870 RepID=UPI001B2A1A5D|nr:hypothetical protein [Psychroserpens sp.]MBO6606156.1 hypothetical protein [Psychroserpens sp.]MBO6631934.1 hypothetical protein [Psychroserpens sp.]MBO6652472.1 hypothetical protein [Psychroserpens sp.]MBO6681756.1 hypothetical protein [Psychroserpens sp.]MBO6749531.1 hypothetical protein [Psychroserpens sp.]